MDPTTNTSPVDPGSTSAQVESHSSTVLPVEQRDSQAPPSSAHHVAVTRESQESKEEKSSTSTNSLSHSSTIGATGAVEMSPQGHYAKVHSSHHSSIVL